MSVDPSTLTLAGLAMAARMASLENDRERADRKRAVVAKRVAEAVGGDPVLHDLPLRPEDLLERLDPSGSRADRLTLIVELAFTDPFAPYELQWRRWDFEVALKEVARTIGLTNADVHTVIATSGEARRAHRRLNWTKIALWGSGGLVAGALGGWLAAPALAAWLGTAAGLSGAAATAHGLALLGGGSLATGGLGAAGGMWIVAGAGAGLGLLSGGGAPLLTEMGAQAARAELLKLEVTFAVVLLGTHTELAKAKRVVEGLRDRQHELEALLHEERLLNDENSARLERLEEILALTKDAREWTNQRLAAQTP
jgi:hypothetical protein